MVVWMFGQGIDFCLLAYADRPLARFCVLIKINILVIVDAENVKLTDREPGELDPSI